MPSITTILGESFVASIRLYCLTRKARSTSYIGTLRVVYVIAILLLIMPNLGGSRVATSSVMLNQSYALGSTKTAMPSAVGNAPAAQMRVTAGDAVQPEANTTIYLPLILQERQITTASEIAPIITLTETLSGQAPACAVSGDLIVASGETCELAAGSYTYSSVTVRSGGMIIARGDTASNTGVAIDAASITIESNGIISTDAQGYPGGTGPGVGGNAGFEGAGGGGHGGTGGYGHNWIPRINALGGSPYGSAIQPTTLGSGGGNAQVGSHWEEAGGTGGGALKLAADTLAVNGTLSANGGIGTEVCCGGNAGGGSGGSIWIAVIKLTGNGTIQANGGNGVLSGGGGAGGGGAGGRIALSYSTSTFSGSVQAHGGKGAQYGGGGTVYWQPLDKLVVDNNDHNGAAAGLIEGSYSFATIELRRYGHLDVLGTNSTLALANGALLGDSTSTLTVSGTVNAPASYTIENATLDIKGNLSGVSDLRLNNKGGLILRANTALHPSNTYGFNNVLVTSGKLTLVPYNNGDTNYTNDTNFHLEATSITIESNGVTSADAQGYPGGTGPGAGGNAGFEGAGGGGHGGTGGQGSGNLLGGISYGSAIQPTTLGSGGGNAQVGTHWEEAGGAGGGAIELTADTLTVNGTLSANGGIGTKICCGGAAGGGSGGSIWIHAISLAGNGTIQANGGIGIAGGGGGPGGGGAGGRIALNAPPPPGLTVQVNGGTGYKPGASGTIYPLVDFVDVEVTGIEVTQAIQCRNNEDCFGRFHRDWCPNEDCNNAVPLLKNKPTWVRVYVRSRQTDGIRVTSLLKGFYSDGTDLPRSPRFFSPGGIVAHANGGDRGNPTHTVNFQLPIEWTREGLITLEAHIYPIGSDLSTSSNMERIVLTFTERNSLTVYSWRFRFDNVAAATVGEVRAATDFMAKTYPLNSDAIDLLDQGELPAQETTWEALVILLNSSCTDIRRNSRESAAVKCYGWVPRGVAITNRDDPESRFFGWTGLGVSAGYIHRDPIAGGQENLAPQYIMAHEIGHTLPPVAHVATAACGGLAGGNFDNQFPANTGSIGEHGFWGNGLEQQVYVPERTPPAHPARYYDFMAYCGVNTNHQWVSPYTYRHLYNAIGAPVLAQTASTIVTSTQEYLIASGVVAPDDSVTVYPFYREVYPVGTDDSPGSGPYSIELQDAQGNVLFIRFFDQQAAHLPAQGSPVDFFEVLPFPSGASRIRIMHNTTLLREVSASANVPQVTVLAPLPEQLVTGTIEILWNGSDADGDPLHYKVEYSTDSGNTWRTIGFNLTDTSLAVNTSDLPGTTQAKIRVLASDGVNTGIGESGLFTVTRKPPEVITLSPQNGAVIAPGQWIHLSGLAEDREDGPLRDAALTWTLEDATQIGTGRQLTLFNPSSGQHTITLTATDSDGNIARGSVAVFIGYNTHLPVIINNRSSQ